MFSGKLQEELSQYEVRNSNFLVLCYDEYCSMDGYPFNKLADMHLLYGFANGNGQRAVHLCQQTFCHRCHPNNKLFATVDCQHSGTETFEPFAVKWRGERSIQTPDVEHILDRNEENLGVSMRQKW
jgi:hypothetical protein